MLGTLTLGLSHSLLVEIKRQARRVSAGWSRSDTTNAVLLGVAAESVLLASILVLNTPATRAVGLVLAVAYAAACGYFVTERRRAIAVATSAAEELEADKPTAKRPSIGKPTTEQGVPTKKVAPPEKTTATNGHVGTAEPTAERPDIGKVVPTKDVARPEKTTATNGHVPTAEPPTNRTETAATQAEVSNRRAKAGTPPVKIPGSTATGAEEHFPTTLEVGVISPPSPTSTANFSDSGHPDRSPYVHASAPPGDVHAVSTALHRRHPPGIGHAPTAAHTTAAHSTVGHATATHSTVGHTAGSSTRPISPGQAVHSHPVSHSHRTSGSHVLHSHVTPTRQPAHEQSLDYRRTPPPATPKRPANNRPTSRPGTGGHAPPPPATHHHRPVSPHAGHNRPVAHAPAAHIVVAATDTAEATNAA